MKWQSVMVVGLVVAVCVVCVTVLAIRGLVPAPVASGAIAGAIGLFNGWLIPSPTHPKEDEE